jgi:hypothetical protein
MPEKFIPQSPDPYLNNEAEMSLIKFGHINFLLDQCNNNVYADNTAALAGGLKVGDFYRNSDGQVFIVIVD